MLNEKIRLKKYNHYNKYNYDQKPNLICMKHHISGCSKFNKMFCKRLNQKVKNHLNRNPPKQKNYI